MDRGLNILIIDDNISLFRDYKVEASKTKLIASIDNVHNTKQALIIVNSSYPDILILDLELGDGNGISFLSELAKSNQVRLPYIIIATNNSSAITLEYARQLGADYIFSKNQKYFSAKKIIDFIIAMYPAIISLQGKPETQISPSPSISRNAPIKYLSQELCAIGITPKLKGYRYLIDAITLISTNPACNYSTIIANSYQKSRASVERAMQNAISHAWTCCDSTEISKHYTAHLGPNKDTPTLMEFIFYYAEIINNML